MRRESFYPEIPADAMPVTLVNLLESHYTRYRTVDAVPDRAARFARLFRHWISVNPNKASESDTEFLEGTEDLTKALAEKLKFCEADTASALALRAVNILMEDQSGKFKTDREWYISAARQYALPLLDYLPHDALQSLHDRMLKETPRRMMFPNEIRLIDRMESILSK